ncbi:MAG: hypothetical protein JSR93_11140 [Verrucomicrobia bacterium]|nr:hypothetical protein [Verrucomicrobiota bacterium]
MKLLRAIRAASLICSNMLSANEMPVKDNIAITSETLSLPQLLAYIEDTVFQIITADVKTSLLAHHELKESLKIIYTLNCLYPAEVSSILQELDECYATLSVAMDRNPDKTHILEQSLSLFTSGHNYDHETLNAQPLKDWTNTPTSIDLKSTLEATDADLVYIQDRMLCRAQGSIPISTIHVPSRLLYSTAASQNSSLQILIIKHKSDGSSEYKFEGGVKWKLGGEDHGKSSAYVEGEVKDKDGTYAKGKISKENGDNGYDCEVKADKEKKNK